MDLSNFVREGQVNGVVEDLAEVMLAELLSNGLHIGNKVGILLLLQQNSRVHRNSLVLERVLAIVRRLVIDQHEVLFADRLDLLSLRIKLLNLSRDGNGIYGLVEVELDLRLICTLPIRKKVLRLAG